MKKVYLLCCLCCFLLGGFAQTIIEPDNGGGFDLGNTFAANGWIAVNSSANKWVVGTATAYSAPNSAYISSDGDVNNYSYDNSTAHISHFYRQVTIPPNANNVLLNFWRQGNVEIDENFLVSDGLEVYVDSTRTVPIADQLPGGEAVLVWPQYTDNPLYSFQSTNLAAFSGRTVFIIFTWKNNGNSIGKGPPSSVDGLSLTYCINNINYNLTGGGGFCTGSDGAPVGLAGSVVGIKYQLYLDDVPVGDPVNGTGAPIEFGPQNGIGNYTVIGTSGTCTYLMPGSVDVIENSLPIAVAGNNSPLCSGGTLNLSASGGSSYSWNGPQGFSSSDQNPIVPGVLPAASGVYTVTVTDDNGCASNANTDVIINPGVALALSSAVGTDAQTTCVNTPVVNITYATTGATGATFSGLPAGVIGNWSGNVVTISGTPTVSGVFNYTINQSGGCTVTTGGSITVTTSNTIILSSGTGTDGQSSCTNTAITPITYATTAATGATFSGLPAGVSGNWSANTVTISGTPSEAGTFNYTVTLTGGCGNITATGSLTVLPANTIALTSAPGTDGQAICVNTILTDISYETTGATGATISGLPVGVSGIWANDVITITGSPSVTGTFNYLITLTGGCEAVTSGGVIIVNPVNTYTLTSAAGTDAQTICVNTPITPVTYSTTGATGVSVVGLPNGVIANWNTNVITISGTPLEAGTFNYTLTLTGGCGEITISGSLSVIGTNNISLSSAAGTDAQTVCANTPLVNITYVTTGATEATFNGLPTGVSGSWAGNVITISGTPASAVGSPFAYTITLTGGCGNITASGNINVTPAASVALSSAPGTNAQSLCKGTSITNITYSLNNLTGAVVSGLPAGVTATPGIGTLTISGTPTETGLFTYVIVTSGGCGPVNESGTITVQGETVSLTSGEASPSLCANTLMTDIVYTMGGTASSASVTGLPAGIAYMVSGNTITISGTPGNSASGPYTYLVTVSGSCASTTVTGIVTIQSSAAAGTVSSVAACSGSSGSLVLSGNTNDPIRWEYTTDTTIATWTNIANTGVSQAFTGITVPTFYRAVTGSACGNIFSTTGMVAIRNYWTGTDINDPTDWDTPANWSDGLVPSSLCLDVFIPNTPNKPVLKAASVAAVTNLHIAAGATVTVYGLLQIAGTISNNGILDITIGTLELNGTSGAQNIHGGLFKDSTVKELIISNDVNVANTLKDTLNITGTLSFGMPAAHLNTGNNITLKSTKTVTANLATLAAGNTITGNVTVERYINIGAGNHAKAWEFLATPTKGQSVFDSWMEKGLTPVGYGTQISGTGTGFDLVSAAPSMKYYDPLSPSEWKGITNTGDQVYNPKGYMIFVRGDRSVNGTTVTAPTPTTLRTTGQLITGTFTLPVAPNSQASIGNPYASAIDMRKVMLDKTSNIDEFFTVWNSNLGGSFGYGIFVTYLRSGSDYINVPGDGTVNNYIQSGQAFFVQNTSSAAGSMTFKETSKATSNSGFVPVFRPQGLSGRTAQLRTNLFAIAKDGTKTLVDGTLQQFADDFSNAADDLDAVKTYNSSENLYIWSGGKELIVERKQLPATDDTVFYKVARLKLQDYRLEFTAGDMPRDGLQAYLEDTYLASRVPLNITGKTEYSFSVTTAAASYAADRFRIVFKGVEKVLPVKITSLNAVENNRKVAVQWTVENERNIKAYEVQRSADGFNFIALTAAEALNSGVHRSDYHFVDAGPVQGYNYYRIKTIDVDNTTSLTHTVKVLISNVSGKIAIYPNRITDGIVHLQLVNQPGGKYGLRLLNHLGQLILKKEVNHLAGSSTQQIQWDYNLAHGMYKLEVTRPDGSTEVLNLVY